MPGFRFFFARFKSEHKGLEGFASKNKLGFPVHYIVIRENWDLELKGYLGPPGSAGYSM